MSLNQYAIRFCGELQPDIAPEQVKVAFGWMFCSDPALLDVIFSRRRVILARNLEDRQADEIMEKLHGIGMIVEKVVLPDTTIAIPAGAAPQVVKFSPLPDRMVEEMIALIQNQPEENQPVANTAATEQSTAEMETALASVAIRETPRNPADDAIPPFPMEPDPSSMLAQSEAALTTATINDAPIDSPDDHNDRDYLTQPGNDTATLAEQTENVDNTTTNDMLENFFTPLAPTVTSDADTDTDTEKKLLAAEFGLTSIEDSATMPGASAMVAPAAPDSNSPENVTQPFFRYELEDDSKYDAIRNKTAWASADSGADGELADTSLQPPPRRGLLRALRRWF